MEHIVGYEKKSYRSLSHQLSHIMISDTIQGLFNFSAAEVLISILHAYWFET